VIVFKSWLNSLEKNTAYLEWFLKQYPDDTRHHREANNSARVSLQGSKVAAENFENTNIFLLDKALCALIESNEFDEKIEDTQKEKFPNNLPFQSVFFEFPEELKFNGNRYKGIWIHEVKPDVLWVGIVNPNGNDLQTQFELRDFSSASVTRGILIHRILYHCHQSVLGYEKVNERLRIGKGSERRVYKIREIVRVIPPSQKKQTEALFSKEIDWTHRYEVRGHWRRIKGIGKDRSGRYGISNFTWVTDHVRGPEEKPLIKKARIVLGNPQETSQSIG
jgi:hypothetical protein